MLTSDTGGEHMTETGFGPFGVVLAEIMRTRGLEPTPQGIRTLAADAGVDPEDLAREMRARGYQDGGLSAIAGDNHKLAWVLCMTEPEKTVYAQGFTYRGSKYAAGATAEALREARRSPEHAAERKRFSDDYPRIPRPLVRYFDREYLDADKSPRCCVSCPRPATMEVRSTPLCAAHGAEARIREEAACT
jgi:hypothetical protein